MFSAQNSGAFPSGFEGGSAVVQRQASLEGTPIPPTGKVSRALWAQVSSILPNPWGVRKYFTEFIKTDQRDFDQPTALIEAFFSWVAPKKKKTKKGEVSVVRNELKLRRPGWPKDYKELLGVQSGDNIRHVVRNATLRDALQRDYDGQVAQGKNSTELTQYYREMHIALLKSDPGEVNAWQIVKSIYKAVYLNIDNLFAGPGGDNQVIGLGADPLVKLGEELVAKGDEEINIVIPFSLAKGIVEGIRLKNVALQKQAESLKAEIISLLDDMWRDYQLLDDGEERKNAPAEDIGLDLIDIGLSLGFDIIDERQPNEGHAQRQKALLEVETALQSGEYQPGNHSLTRILKHFLNPTD